MATLKSRLWSDRNTGHGHEAWSSSGLCKPNYSLNVKNQLKFGTAGSAHLWQKTGRRALRESCLVAQGYGSEIREAYFISDQDKRFVNALREVQPYIFLNRGRTFVVVVAGEIVDSPYFDAILQDFILNGASHRPKEEKDGDKISVGSLLFQPYSSSNITGEII